MIWERRVLAKWSTRDTSTSVLVTPGSTTITISSKEIVGPQSFSQSSPKRLWALTHVKCSVSLCQCVSNHYNTLQCQCDVAHVGRLHQSRTRPSSRVVPRCTTVYHGVPRSHHTTLCSCLQSHNQSSHHPEPVAVTASVEQRHHVETSDSTLNLVWTGNKNPGK